MDETPEERRDAVVAEVISAGGVVLDTSPMATVEDPHTIIAYRLSVGAPDLVSRSALSKIRTRTAVADTADLIDWTPAPIEVAPEEV